MRALLVALGLIGAIASATPESQTSPTVAAADTAPFTTMDTPIGTLLDDPEARAILKKYVPTLTQGGRAEMARPSTLKAIQGYSGGTITDKVLAEMDAELLKLGPKPLPAPQAGTINVNEAKVRPYTLPDPLTLSDGKSVSDAKTWWQRRRPEIVSLFETQEYGIAPGRPPDERFEVFDKGTPAFDRSAIRKQVMIHLSKDPGAPQIQLLEYVPAGAKGRVPMLLLIGFTAPSSMFDDAGIRQSTVWDPQTKQKVPAPKSSATTHVDIKPFLDAGIGVAAFYYGDLDPDFKDGYSLGIRAIYAKGDEASRAPDAWGSIAAWAWGLSRVQDYLETDRAVDAKRVAINGASRLGKTVLWAAARDQRFAAVIACCSGEGGASLSHRNFGETIASLTDMAPYQFARNYQNYANNEQALPMDSHMLLALIAPRAVLLQTGNVDYSADPKGEFLAAVGPVYGLLGKKDLGTDVWPNADQPILHDIGYVMHAGGHGMLKSDWNVYLDFLKMHLHPER
jgi:hypothetical protein